MLVAVDTGATKTLVAIFDQRGAIHDSIRFPTPTATKQYLDELFDAITTITKGKKPTILVVGAPGVIKNGVIKWCGNLPWRDFTLQKRLEEYYPGTRVYLENDANLAGLAETRSLRTIPTSSLYVTISTGIGTGIIEDGKINSGTRDSEGGHILTEYDGVVRTWESFASGAAIYKAYGKYARDITSKKAWKQIADRISRGFLTIIPLLQPSVIIFGGSMGTYFDQYHEQLEKLLRERLPDYIPCPRLIQARHPEHAVIYGCYYYAVGQLSTR